MAEAGAARRGHPLAWIRGEPPPQALHCKHRPTCLDAAIARGFPSFTCSGCRDAEPLSLVDVALEHEGLMRLAGAVLDPARRPQLGQIRSRRGA